MLSRPLMKEWSRGILPTLDQRFSNRARKLQNTWPRIVTDPAKLDLRFRALLTAGLLQPYRTDSKLQDDKRTQLDRLYQKIVNFNRRRRILAIGCGLPRLWESVRRLE